MTTIRVRYANAARKVADSATEEPSSDVSGGWRPATWLGAPATGGLALPSAQPTASWLYAPRGVHLGQVNGQDALVVADTGNHRVMIWHTVPDADGQPCDVVLGQPDATSEGPAAGGPRRGLNLPTGVLIHEGRLIVADAWHHRVLVYNTVPRSGDVAPDVVLGQPDLDSVQPNRGGDCALNSLYWPFGINVVGGRFYIADTGNRRVLGWSAGVPQSPDEAPDLVLGQPDPRHREENRGADAGADSFRWPHGVAGDAERLFVADAGNHRVLGWSPHPVADQPARQVLGQTDFCTATEWPYAPQRPDTVRFPYSVDVDEGRLAVSDTANNRVLIWPQLPGLDAAFAAPAQIALGQPTFAANGENRWDSVARDTLCWPYGVSLRGDLLAVADSGNNRVMLWRRS